MKIHGLRGPWRWQTFSILSASSCRCPEPREALTLRSLSFSCSWFLRQSYPYVSLIINKMLCMIGMSYQRGDSLFLALISGSSSPSGSHGPAEKQAKGRTKVTWNMGIYCCSKVDAKTGGLLKNRSMPTIEIHSLKTSVDMTRLSIESSFEGLCFLGLPEKFFFTWSQIECPESRSVFSMWQFLHGSNAILWLLAKTWLPLYLLRGLQPALPKAGGAKCQKMSNNLIGQPCCFGDARCMYM